ncbi:MAG TPA: sulfotransferase [Rhizomicrobium sp.]|jgi:hypothetical protein|nr:sulfotransferase [Rhizomicrobium sp.]
MADQRPKLFIVGVSRSGTSAFARLLGQHKQIMIGIERYRGLVQEKAVEDWPDNLFDKDVFFIDELKRNKFNRAHYDEQLAKYDTAKWVGDKIPAWLAYVEPLRKKFPNSVFLCMLREPKDVGFSFESKAEGAQKGFWLNKTFEHGVMAAARAYAKAEAVLKAGTPDFYMVEYDRVFPYDLEYLKAILARLELEPDESILEYYRGASKQKSEKVGAKERMMDPARIKFVEEAIDRSQFEFLRSHSVDRS